MPAERVLIAKIGAAHGVRGEVRLFAYTEEPLAIRSYGELEDESGTRRFRIVALRPAKDHLVARFEGIGDRDEAAKLTHLELYVPRARLPKQKAADTFYCADLIGLAVETKAGEKLGEVVGVQNFGAGDLLEIKRAHGENVLIPFIDQYVPAVDIEGGKIVAEPPKGLFDESTKA
ncbi:MAG TPA: ribosome maturation factor RimM [Xanthobacteraceae bacterium]|nr:ribosome maturation factor RimM [Xanthobacteraceae bacterium]